MNLIRTAVVKLCRNRADARAVLREQRRRNAKVGEPFERAQDRRVDRHWRPALAWVLLDLQVREPNALVLGLLVYGGILATFFMRLVQHFWSLIG
ncbi:hypothetical protein [Paraburkholderia tropica]|uniref:hypothetical protein n=1 Tax=Paraburkholderia tropica TaxID=92647 RepID=UPI002AB5EAEC|nr:hypothetical protein [Paraburkholderia tropica]